MSTEEQIQGLLELLTVEPTLLDPAPADVDVEQFDERVDEGHSCLRCGEFPAEAVVFHAPDDEPRWLDLCTDCKHALADYLA